MKNYHFGLIIIIALMGCSSPDEDAVKKGFSSHKEMIEINKLGFSEKKDYLISLLPGSGCSNIEELEHALSEVGGNCKQLIAQRLKEEQEREVTMAKVKSLGFDSEGEMLDAQKEGIVDGGVWRKQQAIKKNQIKHKNAGLLEKALLFYVSSRDDFMFHKNNGGLSRDSSWNGYTVSEVRVGHNADSQLLTYYQLYVDFDAYGTKKVLTVGSLKGIIGDICGESWEKKFDGAIHLNDSTTATCKIEQADRGGYSITVALKD
jgi:hypothetical protein